MVLPSQTDERWKQLATGEIQYNCEVMAANMLLKRVVLAVQQDNTEQNIQQAIQEIYQFFVRYESILESDIVNIFRKT